MSGVRRRAEAQRLLATIYGGPPDGIMAELDRLVDAHRSAGPGRRQFDHTDTVLITYGDIVRRPGEAPLRSLADLLETLADGIFSAIHILPFFPWSSDDGFAVVDFRRVDPALGDWSDVGRIGRRFDLMIDLVMNHVSTSSRWFQGFLTDEARFRGYFITVDPHTDLSAVFRPRAQPLLTPFETAAGLKWVWTTFGPDQPDLNYADPRVLMDMIEVLLTYVDHGARIIRLDAVGFLWKQPGTSCLHLSQTHAVVQLLRLVLEEAAPGVALVTETNVPHEDNISYFGDGTNEAHMVYNFSLPPLTLHAFHTGDASVLSSWAGTLEVPTPEVTFFNFLASHDGIGVTPARGWLTDEDVANMADRVRARGGHVSSRTRPDGSEAPYEFNITYLDALGGLPQLVAAHAIMLAMRGVPAIYFHSLVGSRNWHDGVAQTGRARSINRQKLGADELMAELTDDASEARRAYAQIAHLLSVRRRCLAFHPAGSQTVLESDPAVFALQRRSPDGLIVTCLHNVADREVSIATAGGVDLVSGEKIGAGAKTLGPYQVAWIREAVPA